MAEVEKTGTDEIMTAEKVVTGRDGLHAAPFLELKRLYELTAIDPLIDRLMEVMVKRGLLKNV